MNRILSILIITVMVSCSPPKKEEAQEVVAEQEEIVQEEVVAEVKEAMAIISSANESGLTGTAVFIDKGEGVVSFTINIENASQGEHAVHLHQNGDCSAPDATSAGGHWNPNDAEHGNRAEGGSYHSGDIDNIVVGEDGKGSVTMEISGWSVGGDEATDVINKAVIIHADADDFTSQPSGAAGKRVGCGVIEGK